MNSPSISYKVFQNLIRNNFNKREIQLDFRKMLNKLNKLNLDPDETYTTKIYKVK